MGLNRHLGPRLLIFLGALLLSLGGLPCAQAQAPPVVAPAQPPGEQSPAAAAIDGFRSVKFGMTEDQARRAIRREFRVGDEQIQTATNPRERTRALAVEVRDLLPQTGRALVSFVFGFKSKRLIQANVSWAAGEGQSRNLMAAIAVALQRHFSGLRLEGGERVMNVTLPNGELMLFRGFDAQGRMVALAARPPAGANARDAGWPPASVLLSYIENPKEPDVFRQ